MNLFDDEASEGTSEDENIPVRSSQYDDVENERPSKRRRLVNSSDSEDEYDLPENDARSQDSSEKPQRARHLVHVPEFTGGNDTLFVTQLDELHSSPSRMRGPRWRKAPPKVATPKAATPKRPSPRVQSNMLSGGHTRQQAPDVNDDLAFDFEGDVNDDLAMAQAFEQLSTPTRQVSNRRQAPAAFRQTTLFGATSPQRASQAANRTHNWPMANRREAPTHHKLDIEALKTYVYPTNLGTIREYQYNIVARALYHNMLVALPTGLGKTFIAATVMLNWFRWTKDSQMVFMAPTKPLVAQQVEACFHIAGIPRSQTTMLIGNVPSAIREQEWKSKRVFFMTPQTLENDLKLGICDPKRIVLIVVDEAHRAKGEYAYVKVVKFLRRFNTSFRVLALTATPGSTVESVQDVIDGLGISRVEIRTEEALDIRQYVHTRNIEPVVLENSDEMEMLLDLFSKAVQPTMRKVTSQNAYWNKDPLSITLFGLRKAQQDWMRQAGRNQNQGVKATVNAVFTILMTLAIPLENLKFHSIAVFHRKAKLFEEEAWKGKSSNKRDIVGNEHWKKMMNRLNTWVTNPDFDDHPKMAYLKSVVLNHFMDRERSGRETKIMVFSHYRDSAEEITRVLNGHQPMVKAHVFVGQAASKGSEGMDQKTQQSVVNKFKDGTYNTLVATSIGEEGLDIGEVDLIVCYDASKSPIRLLQRMGRTGRKRAGNITLLMMKGKEQRDYEAATDNYVKMQEKIASGRDFRFHDDENMRIVPMEITPVVDKRTVDIPIENTQGGGGDGDWLPMPAKKGRKLKQPKKKFHMPDDVETGFSFLGQGKQRQSKIDKAVKTKEAEKLARLPEFDDVCLSVRQLAELEEKYIQIDGKENQFIQIPRMDAHPEKMRKKGKHWRIGMSLGRKRIRAAYRAMRDSKRSWKRPTKQPDISNMLLDERSDSDGGDDWLSRTRNVRDAEKDMASTFQSTHDEPINLTQVEDAWDALQLKHRTPVHDGSLNHRPDHDAEESEDEDAEMQEDLPDITDLLPQGKASVAKTRPGQSRVGRNQAAPGRARRVLDDSSDEE